MDLTATDLYALLHAGNPGDIEFYQRVCAGCESVLEIGSGWGRLLGPLTSCADHITGVELNPAMQRAATNRISQWPPERRDAVELVTADMRTLALERTFDRIIVPYCGLYCLKDDKEVVATLRRLADHLTPDGLLVFDGYDIGDPAEIDG